MRVRVRVLSAVLLGLLLFSTVPAQAAVLPVEPRNPPVRVLPPAEFQKIQAFQQVVTPQILSETSPDDATVVAFLRGGRQPGFVFVNLQDSTSQPITFESGDIVFPITEVRWRDNQTAIFLGEDDKGYLLVTLSRATNTAKATPLDLPGYVVSLAPDASSVLIAAGGGDPFRPNSPLASHQSPFDLEINRGVRSASRQDEASVIQARIGLSADDEIWHFASRGLGLSVLNLNTKKSIDLLDLPAGSALQSVSWSPDSSKLTLVRTGFLQVTPTGDTLTSLITQDALGQLPPADNPLLQNNVVDLIDLGAGQVSPAALKAASGNGDTFMRVQWSPDNQTLLAQMSVPGHVAGRAYPVYGFTERAYLRFYSPDGQLQSTFENSDIDTPSFMLTQLIYFSPTEVVINAVKGMSETFFYYNRASGELRRLPIPAGTASGGVVTRNSRQLLFRFSSYTQVRELFRINLDGSALAALTYTNNALAQLNQVRADEVSFTLANGQQRSGYLIQPAQVAFPPKNIPVVVWQEGGPRDAVLNRYSTLVEAPFNLLPNFGIALLVVPLPGRFGYGPAFLNALVDNRNYGKIDIDEQAEIVQQMITRGYTTPGQVGITGCSYGGYFAAQSIVRHPDLYAAANPQCSPLDDFHEWQFGDTFDLSFYLSGVRPTEDPARYIEISPLYNASKAKAATLLFHGSRDFLPARIAVNFHDQLQANGAAVNLYLFNNEGHGLSRPSSQISASQLQIDWFRQYLKGVSQ